ncbi:MAG: oxidative damage protection protein [Methylicorpusculum sp.]|nr:oxidative damage protection protein [Methylicorpusculum sp.]
MTRMVKCAKLGIESEGLDTPPFPGPKGQYIYENISKQVWQEWLSVQTMLLNEHRMTSFDPKAKKFLVEERANRLSSRAPVLPEGYVPPPQ